jgi:hypothetical protein
MTTLITGNTYPVRAEMRALGGTWNKQAQGWNVPTQKADEARAIVAAAPPSAPRRTRYNRNSGYTRFSTGAEVYRNPRGRCEDAPCCGCCS